MTSLPEDANPIKQMRLRYAGRCGCGQQVPAGTHAGWNSALRQVTCPNCLVGQPPSPAQQPEPPGVAGASLQREYERRSRKREERIRAAHPRLGGLILALSDEPPSTQAFKIGAEGERKAVRLIQDRCGPGVVFLLNRSLGPRRRDGDIDVIAIGPAGVHIADVKHYKDQKVEVRRSGGLFSSVKEQLYIGGRDRTALLHSMARQLDAVRMALTSLHGGDAVQVHPALVFVDADLPLFSTPRVGGVPCLGTKQAAERFSAHGSLDLAAITQVHEHLSRMLPAAY